MIITYEELNQRCHESASVVHLSACSYTKQNVVENAMLGLPSILLYFAYVC